MSDAGEPEKLATNGPPTAPEPPPAVEDVAHQQEDTRAIIAFVLLGILAAIVLFSYITVWTRTATMVEVKGILSILVAPVVGLLGAATGFYYGAIAEQPPGLRRSGRKVPATKRWWRTRSLGR